MDEGCSVYCEQRKVSLFLKEVEVKGEEAALIVMYMSLLDLRFHPGHPPLSRKLPTLENHLAVSPTPASKLLISSQKLSHRQRRQDGRKLGESQLSNMFVRSTVDPHQLICAIIFASIPLQMSTNKLEMADTMLPSLAVEEITSAAS
eukprot:196302-Hanusia_phi.AAC.3